MSSVFTKHGFAMLQQHECHIEVLTVLRLWTLSINGLHFWTSDSVGGSEFNLSIDENISVFHRFYFDKTNPADLRFNDCYKKK